MIHRVQKLKGFWAMLYIFYATVSYSQDTVKISLPEAEDIFIQKNLTLLSEKYNIEIAKAQIIQARLYSNPNIQLTGNIYNPEQKKNFDISNKTGEYVISVQQLILLAGKRNKQIALAQTNANITEDRFYDLLRTLRFTLRSDFYQAYFLHNSIEAYDLQLQQLEKLDSNIRLMKEKELVTLKDAVRIRSMLYSLRSERTMLLNQFTDVQAEIQLLLQNNKHVFIPILKKELPAFSGTGNQNLHSLIDSAYNNRYDLRALQRTVLYNQQNYSLQKAMAVPDLTIGSQFDKRGSFVENASFLSIGIDLPLFNRNQGNIKAARLSMEQSKLDAQKQNQQVENEVQHAFVNALNTEKMLRSIDPGFRNEFEKLLYGVVSNYEKRNISLLELTDFYESYKQNILQLNQIQNLRMQAIENLNYAVGRTIIN
jgi:cobalt-zinc-cadmium efflux system outer membrane protein